VVCSPVHATRCVGVSHLCFVDVIQAINGGNATWFGVNVPFDLNTLLAIVSNTAAAVVGTWQYACALLSSKQPSSARMRKAGDRGDLAGAHYACYACLVSQLGAAGWTCSMLCAAHGLCSMLDTSGSSRSLHRCSNLSEPTAVYVP
jgi:hypothetical protein